MTRVLLVDDHDVVRQSLARLLEGQEDIVIAGQADSGEAGVRMARELSPDVVLMDISMPGMNGIEATRRIRAELPEVNVIGLSMFEEADRAEAMREAGACTYLSKAVSSEILLSAIRNLVQ